MDLLNCLELGEWRSVEFELLLHKSREREEILEAE